MSAPALVLPSPFLPSDQGTADDVLNLGQLMELFSADDDLSVSPPVAVGRAVSELGADLAVRLRGQLQDWSGRAAGWGSGPQGAWRAW
ncbi:MAG TPA: hypothetical protein VGN47_10930 [Blastococcus sp.]|nr:hypothetical protein [Blastococcus sp.]